MLFFLLAGCLHGQTLLWVGRQHWICAQGGSWSRKFRVPQDCSATVTINRLVGLTHTDRGEARLWLDRRLLGPLRKEFNSKGWEEVHPLRLTKGWHTLSIECGTEGFHLSGLRVGTPRRHRSKAAGLPIPRVPRPHAPPLAKPSLPFVLFNPCPGLILNDAWPAQNPIRSLILSVVTGRAARSGVLTTLKRGQRVRWWFNISPQVGSVPFPPLLLSEVRVEGERWALRFSVDEAEGSAEGHGKNGIVGPRGYRPGAWTPLDLAFCPDGRFMLETNDGDVRGSFRVVDPEMQIEVWSRGVEMTLRGDPPVPEKLKGMNYHKEE